MTGSRTSSVKIFSVSSGVGDGSGDGFGFAGSWLEICVAASANKAAMTRRPVVRFSQHIVGIGCLMPRKSERCHKKAQKAQKKFYLDLLLSINVLCFLCLFVAMFFVPGLGRL